MAKKLIKVTTLRSESDVNEKLGELRKVSAKLKKIEADLDQKKADLDNKYNTEINDLNEQKLLCETDLELWSESHKTELTTKRSWDFINGAIGFRQSQKLVTVGKLAWKDVIERAVSLKKKFKNYLDEKTTLKKDVLRSDLINKNLSLDDAAEIGVSLQADDSFFIDLMETDVTK